MNRAFSIYLDLVRFLAACLVYLYHSNQRLLSTEILPVSNYGHSSGDRVLCSLRFRYRLHHRY